MGRLEGRVAFVTGAGRGIGAATALRLAEEGARVALADIDTEGCKQVAAQLERQGSEGLVVACNVADKAMVQEAMEQTVNRFVHRTTSNGPYNARPISFNVREKESAKF